MEEQTHCQDDLTTIKGLKTTKALRYCRTKCSLDSLSPQKNHHKMTSKSERGLIPTNSKRSTISGTIKVNESSLEVRKKNAPLSRQNTIFLSMVTLGSAKQYK